MDTASKNLPWVLIQAPINEELFEFITDKFRVVCVKEFEENKEKYSSRIVAIFNIWHRPKITEGLLNDLPNLKVIVSTGVGYDHLDVAMIRKRGVRIGNTPNVVTNATAEFAMGLMLCSARNIIKDALMYKHTNFTKLDHNTYSPVQVSGSTMGKIGMGKIGLAVAKMASGFDMKILYHSRKVNPQDETVKAKFFPHLSDMLPLCDFIIITVCLTPQTKHIISRDQFGLMRKNVILVNISRGGTLDQDALVAALDEGKILGAALDVTYPEPLPREHPLVSHPKVIITPHAGTNTFPTKKAVIGLAVDNVVACLNGRAMPSEVIQ